MRKYLNIGGNGKRGDCKLPIFASGDMWMTPQATKNIYFLRK